MELRAALYSLWSLALAAFLEWSELKHHISPRFQPVITERELHGNGPRPKL